MFPLESFALYGICCCSIFTSVKIVLLNIQLACHKYNTDETYLQINDRIAVVE